MSYVSLVDKKIEHYSGEFGSENADKFLDMLTEKYGKPKMETAERQNMMGAKFSSFRASWKVDGYNITLRSPSLKVGRGSIWIMSDKYIQYNDNKKREEKAKAGKNL